MIDPNLRQLTDQAALRRCAELYAQGADRRDASAWRAVLAEDCVIEGPGFSKAGLADNLASLDQLGQMFKATFHRIHNQLATIDGDRASGETYCTADHLFDAEGQEMILSWNIRYQDQLRRESGGWRFTSRMLVVDWEDLRPRGSGRP